MTDNNTNTLDLIEQINDLRAQELEIRAAIEAAVAERKALTRQRDADRREKTEQALIQATKMASLREQELAFAEESLFSLEDRLDRGDDSVSAEDLTFAEKALDRAKRLLAAAKSTKQEAERQAKIDRSDSMLSTRLAEIIEANLEPLGLSGFDVDVRTRPGKQTPPTGRQIAICQQADTESKGTLRPMGQMLVLVYAPAGELPKLDTIALAQLFGDNDTMRVIETSTPEPLDDPDYVRQTYVLNGSLAPEIPHLFGGSEGELTAWIGIGIDMWCDQIKFTRDVEGRVLTYKQKEGRAQIVSSLIAPDPEAGIITSEVTLTLVTEERIDSTIVRSRAESIFGDLWLGDHTLLGKIDSIDVGTVEETRVPYAGERDKVMTYEQHASFHEEAYTVELTITGLYVALEGAR